ERLVGASWLFLIGGYLLVAWIWLLAAGFSYLVRPDSEAVGAFSRWALLNALVLLTAFDLHTTPHPVPLFSPAYALLPAATLELGMRFPDDMAPLLRAPALVLVPRLGGLALFFYLAISLAFDGHALYVGGLVLSGSILGLAVLMAVRCFLAE